MGKTYRYSYQTQIISGAASERTDCSVYVMDITADISVISACDYQLSVGLVGIKDQQTPLSAKELKDLSLNLEKNVIHFGFYNGQIGEVCAPDDESPVALNIKKGLLSAFQISATKNGGFSSGMFLEVDATGECPTIYTLLKNGNEVVLNRTRDTSFCSRKSDQPNFSGHAAHFATTFESLVETKPYCEHLIGDGVTQTATCIEDHIFQPFKGRAVPMTVRVTQQLTFNSVIDQVTRNAPSGKFPSFFSDRKSLRLSGSRWNVKRTSKTKIFVDKFEI